MVPSDLKTDLKLLVQSKPQLEKRKLWQSVNRSLRWDTDLAICRRPFFMKRRRRVASFTRCRREIMPGNGHARIFRVWPKAGVVHLSS